MDRNEFMELVYETFADEPDNVLANGIIEAADAYVEHEKAQLSHEGKTSDTISRQAAIDVLSLGKEMLSRVLDDMDVVGTDREKYSWGLGLIESYINDIKELPTVQPEQQWIPCSERLPNHDEYIKNNGLFNVSDGNRSYSEWFDIYDKQMFGEPTMAGFRVDYAVTAWMPLPRPYKGEGEQE